MLLVFVNKVRSVSGERNVNFDKFNSEAMLLDNARAISILLPYASRIPHHALTLRNSSKYAADLIIRFTP